MADPRLLQSVGYGNTIPPSQDRFYGQGMSAQPGFLESIARKFFNPSDPGIGPQALESAPMAMIPTIKNLPVFKQKMAEISKNLMTEWDMPERYNPKIIADAIAFAKTRYPNITNLVEKFNPVANYSNVATQEVGRYMPDIKEALVSFKNPAGLHISPEDIVNTAVHESRHALSHNRTPQIFWPAFEGNSAMNAIEESRAYGSGDTGSAAYRTFLNLLKQEK